jgi:hypothetical protein
VLPPVGRVVEDDQRIARYGRATGTVSPAFRDRRGGKEHLMSTGTPSCMTASIQTGVVLIGALPLNVGETDVPDWVQYPKIWREPGTFPTRESFSATS